MGLVALRHVEYSQTGAGTRVPCIGRQILNHCGTREVLSFFLIVSQWLSFSVLNSEVRDYLIPCGVSLCPSLGRFHIHLNR